MAFGYLFIGSISIWKCLPIFPVCALLCSADLQGLMPSAAFCNSPRGLYTFIHAAQSSVLAFSTPCRFFAFRSCSLSFSFPLSVSSMLRLFISSACASLSSFFLSIFPSHLSVLHILSFPFSPSFFFLFSPHFDLETKQFGHSIY